VARRVLIVDDHPSFRRFAARLLEAGGFSVVGEAGDGATGVAEARRLRPDLVLLDVLLPDTNGFAVADALAAEPGAPAVVLVSSRSAGELGTALAGTPAAGFVTKRDLTAAAVAALAGGTA
jgi:two-component system nitrate/nitrite response regulator NarL